MEGVAAWLVFWRGTISSGVIGIGTDERKNGEASCGGSERHESAEVKATRLVAEELKRRGWDSGELERRRNGDEEKIELAQRLRRETTMTWDWIAAQLRMGAPACAAQCARRARGKNM